MRPLVRLLSLVAVSAAGLVFAGAALAVEPNCVTVCQAKVDACGAQCEALADSVYDDPASLEQCQLGCAKGLFVSCVERCNATGQVVADDYHLAAPNPDRLPPSAPEAPEAAETAPPAPEQTPEE